MIAVYDLSVNPPTYDVCTFLGFVEMERQRRKSDSVGIKIIPGPHHGFRKDQLWPKTIDERKQLLNRIVTPMCWLLPHVESVTVETKTHGYNRTFGYN